MICTDVCKSRIHDHRDYRDFRLVPWFLAIAVTIAVNLCHGHDYHQNVNNLDIYTVKFGEFGVNTPISLPGEFVGWSIWVGTDQWSRSVARLSLISCAACVRQTDTASMWWCDHPASQTSDSGNKHPNLSLTTQTTRPCNILIGAGAWDRPTDTAATAAGMLDDVASWAT